VGNLPRPPSYLREAHLVRMLPFTSCHGQTSQRPFLKKSCRPVAVASAEGYPSAPAGPAQIQISRQNRAVIHIAGARSVGHGR